MKEKEKDFLKKLLATFKIEAREHINSLISGLIELEKKPPVERRMEITEAIFREAHSLKGAARAVNFSEIESICQSLESAFAKIKRQEIVPTPALFDLFHKALDLLDRLLLSSDVERTATEKSLAAELTQTLHRALEDVPPSPPQEEPESKRAEVLEEKRPILPEMVRISKTRLDSVLLQAEEMLSTKLSINRLAMELREFKTSLQSLERECVKVSPEARRIRRFTVKREGTNGQGKNNLHPNRLIEYFDWNYTHIKLMESKLNLLANLADRYRYTHGRMVDQLLQDMKKVSMQPFLSLLEIFPKIGRDLSREQGKEVELLVFGGEIEVDQRILEEIKDPLIHLVRNCIDHGIEKPEERTRKGKPQGGTIAIAISPQNSNHVEITISDDGAGIDVHGVRTAALKLGILSKEMSERLSEAETLSLIFQSGVSTSPIVTDVSGRGLGLAIVREKVEKLNGVIELETNPDAGTRFRIVLPLTLATFRGLLVRAAGHLFVLPTIYIKRVVKVNREEIKTVENRETIQLNGQAVSLVRLSDVLELPAKKEEGDPPEGRPVVVLNSVQQCIAFLVEEIFDEQEVLVKSLGKQLSRVRNMAGATVLGTGEVVPILNVQDLMKSAVMSTTSAQPAIAVDQAEEKRKYILVAEDSITARSLLKNILESSGYNVKTAVDGVDAFVALKAEDFNLVISDVDMPRMNGFDLTAKIRGDKRLSSLPVVLVTALESREDRERGIDVGANAYIIKSSFDQSNLLEVVKRLI